MSYGPSGELETSPKDPPSQGPSGERPSSRSSTAITSVVSVGIFLALCGGIAYFFSSAANRGMDAMGTVSSSGTQPEQQYGTSTSSMPIQSQPLNMRITAGMIAGNPRKYVGEHVKLRCKVLDVPGGGIANVMCGEDIEKAVNTSSSVDYSDPNSVSRSIQKQQEGLQRAMDSQGMLVIHGDQVASLDGNARIVVDGIVAESMHGKTGLGVERDFPTVDINWVKEL